MPCTRQRTPQITRAPHTAARSQPAHIQYTGSPRTKIETTSTAVAREMLATDPQLRADFERRLRDDPAFAADPEARLDYFHQRHASRDDRYRLYPVYRR